MANFQWIDGTNGTFTAADWTTAGHPLAGDSATLGGVMAYTVTVNPAASFSYGTILVTNPQATLDIEHPLTGSLTLARGTVLLNSTLTVLGSETFTGGHFNFGTSGATVTIAASLSIASGVTVEAGTLSSFIFAGPGSLTNAGTIKIDPNPAATSILAGSSASGQIQTGFTNTGQVSIGTGSLFEVAASRLTNTGTINVGPTAGLVLLGTSGLSNLAGGLVSVANGGFLALDGMSLTGAALGSLVAKGSGVTLASGGELLLVGGIVDNTGATLDFSGGANSLPLTTGVYQAILGGTVIAGPNLSTTPVVPGVGFEFGSSTLLGTLDMSGSFSSALLAVVSFSPSALSPTLIEETGASANIMLATDLFADNVDFQVGNAASITTITGTSSAMTLGPHGVIDEFGIDRRAVIGFASFENMGTIIGEALQFGTGLAEILVEGTTVSNDMSGQVLVHNGDVLALFGLGGLNNAGTVLADSNPLYSQSACEVVGPKITNTGAIVADDALVVLQANTLNSSGTLLARNGGTLQVLADSYVTPPTLQFGPGANTIEIGSTLFPGTITNFGTGDDIILLGATATGFSVFGQTVAISTASTLITIATFESFTTTPTFSVTNGLAGVTITNNGSLFGVCYARGTRILTDTGERPVESLRAGDRVVTLHRMGASRIRWIGHQTIDLSRHPAPARVRPVRVMRDAFGSGLPHRDLVLSPEHALFLDGVLIPVRYLVDDRAIRFEPRDSVEYFHIELDRHDIVIAEGLRAETWLDTGNRVMFDNGGGLATLHPDFAPDPTNEAWMTRACAPLHLAGPVVEAIRRRVGASAERSVSLTLTVTPTHRAL